MAQTNGENFRDITVAGIIGASLVLVTMFGVKGCEKRSDNNHRTSVACVESGGSWVDSRCYGGAAK